MSQTVNIIFAGLGGQGVLKATDILSEALFASGFDVKKSEVHGMSQRGGSVTSEVRFGEQVNSPMVPEGEADFLVVMEPSQLEVNRSKLKSGGVIVNVSDYPVEKLANAKALNTLLLGALSVYLPLEENALIDTVKRHLPARLHEVNVAAFELGRSASSN